MTLTEVQRAAQLAEVEAIFRTRVCLLTAMPRTRKEVWPHERWA